MNSNALRTTCTQLDALLAGDRLDVKRAVAVLETLLERKVLNAVDRRLVDTRRKRLVRLLDKPPSATRGIAYYARIELAPVAALLHRLATDERPAASAETLAAKDADRAAGGTWFSGYAKRVTVEDRAVIDGDFDEARRTAHGPEYVLFRRGLRVRGTLRLAAHSRSIYVVLGELEAEAVELGDSVLVVTKKLRATKYVFSPPNEGVCAVGRSGAFSFRSMTAPLVVWREHSKWHFARRVGAKWATSQVERDHSVKELLSKLRRGVLR